MAPTDRNSMRPTNQRHSLVAASSASIQRQRNIKDTAKSTRSSSAFTGTTSSTTSPNFAQKTKSSSSRLSDVKLEESNISVYVRCRSRNEREVKESSGVVVSTMGHMGKEVVLQTGPMSVSNKTYTFDRVFGAESDQEMVYEGIAESVLQEMLQGYNCTVFAYGQTGTGKTYTMSGDITMTGNRLSGEAGIIPRTLVDLFKELEKNPEFSVKISFIELYNEELRDLIPINDGEDRKVRIFEDPVKKSIVVQGMEEVYIKSADEGMRLLADGSYKRQVAATQCNDLSSRSHSVFTITVHMKEIDPISGEEYLKIGKLNLVDLAGSENINRSGAENKRAREAGMINQSLLTLGRVINALVDQSPHIPYRESKLTRLLQDSLGGRTKTCIIATISPAKVSLEETISTLEYANRAKSIKNKPQVNQTMSKKMLIKEYVQEIERLRADLSATRNKNGVYLTEENLQQITSESESRRIQVDEQKLRINVLEEQIKKLKNDFEDNINQIKSITEELQSSKEERSKVERTLQATSNKLKETEIELRVEKLLNADRMKVEKQLRDTHTSLTALLNEVESVRQELYNILDHKHALVLENVAKLEKSKGKIIANTGVISGNISHFQHESQNLSATLNENFTKMVETQRSKIQERCRSIAKESQTIEEVIESSLTKVLQVNQSMDSELGSIDELKNQIMCEIVKKLNDLREGSEQNTKILSKGLVEVSGEIDNAFEEIGSHIKETITTVQSQFSNQSAEILSLKTKYVEHQSKYLALLNHQISKITNSKESEKQQSKLEKETLLQKIAVLLDEHERCKLARLEENVSAVVPELEEIGARQSRFANNFESFISNEWVQTQTSFKETLLKQSNFIRGEIDRSKNSIRDNQITTMNDILHSHDIEQGHRFGNTIDSIGSTMESLAACGEQLKKLNSQNFEYTQSQLKDINSKTANSMKDIIHGFIEFGEELSNSKPELVDDFLNKQQKFLETHNSTTIANLEKLESYVHKLKYSKDDNPVPKRQKLQDIPIELPTAKTREEIIQDNHDVIYPLGEPQLNEEGSENPSEINSQGSNEVSTAVPIPDKQFKQPLAKSNRDLNVQRPESEGEKKVKRSSISRSNSTSSTLNSRTSLARG